MMHGRNASHCRFNQVIANQVLPTKYCQPSIDLDLALLAGYPTRARHLIPSTKRR
jgi:hypothetical protein